LAKREQQILGVRSKAEAIRLALKEVVRRKRLSQGLSHRGTVDLGIDQATLEELRVER
jgi:hypothetical protein